MNAMKVSPANTTGTKVGENTESQDHETIPVALRTMKVICKIVSTPEKKGAILSRNMNFRDK